MFDVTGFVTGCYGAWCVSPRNRVAGILDKHGGIRTASILNGEFHNVLDPDDLLFVVPDLLVADRVPWEMIPHVTARAKRRIFDWAERLGERHNEHGPVIRCLNNRLRNPGSVHIERSDG